MPAKTNKNKGALGEEIAASFLASLGFKIIERNFKKRYGDIDIVAIEKDTLVFVEVKTRLSNSFGLPQESITPWKIRQLIQSANYYKMIHPQLPDALRIDVVSILLTTTEKVEKIDIFKNITL